MPELLAFSYSALNRSGRKVSGTVEAESKELAFVDLRRRDLSPTSLSLRRTRLSSGRFEVAVSDSAAAEFAADLSALLKAGANMRSALEMLSDRSSRDPTVRLAESLLDEVSGGASVGGAFSRRLGGRKAFIGSLISASEGGSGIASGLQRAADMLTARVTMREQLLSTLSYPFFVLVTTVAAFGVILFGVVPALAPIIDESPDAPGSLRAIIAISAFMRSHALELTIALVLLALGSAVLVRLQLFSSPLQRLVLDRVGRRTIGGLVYGSFAQTLGSLLVGGSSMSDALRLSIQSISNSAARQRLEAVELQVRQGQTLSDCFAQLNGFPSSIARLAMVGEASGSLGEMLLRAGTLEETKAVRRLEAIGKFLGPAMIVLLGAAVGLLMVGLLSGISQLGASAVPS